MLVRWKAEAVTASVESAARVRAMKQTAYATPPMATMRHIPFAGHRTVAQVDAARRAASARADKRCDYGYDPSFGR